MRKLERITPQDGMDSIRQEDFKLLADALPSVITCSSRLQGNPELYYSRMPCFLHGFCYGGLSRLFIGDLAQLWEQGYFRDGEVFFFGGTGGFSGGILWGVNAHTGETRNIRTSPQSLWEATQKVWCPDISCRTVKRPDYTGKQAEFPSMIESVTRRMSLLPLSVLQPPLPERCRNMEIAKPMHRKLGHFIPVLEDRNEPGRFEIMADTVSLELWRNVTGRNQNNSCDSRIKDGISWHESMAFASFLSIQDAEYDYRLSTESELETVWKWTRTESSARIGLTGGFEWCSSRYEPPDKDKSRCGTGFRVLKRAADPSHSCGHQPWCSSFGENRTAFRLVRTRKEKH